MILIVISGDNNYRLTVADSLVPGNFPEHVAVEVGETIDADSADANQQFVLAVLLSIGVITEKRLSVTTLWTRVTPWLYDH